MVHFEPEWLQTKTVKGLQGGRDLPGGGLQGLQRVNLGRVHKLNREVEELEGQRIQEWPIDLRMEPSVEAREQ